MSYCCTEVWSSACSAMTSTMLHGLQCGGHGTSVHHQDQLLALQVGMFASIIVVCAGWVYAKRALEELRQQEDSQSTASRLGPAGDTVTPMLDFNRAASMDAGA